jgi:hypothetical protein
MAEAEAEAEALLYAAFGASAQRALSVLLHHRLAFIGARSARAQARVGRGAEMLYL